MMKKYSSIFLARDDALLVYLAKPCTKNIPQHLFGAINLVRTHLMNDFSPLTLLSICTCTYFE